MLQKHLIKNFTSKTMFCQNYCPIWIGISELQTVYRKGTYIKRNFMTYYTFHCHFPFFPHPCGNIKHLSKMTKHKCGPKSLMYSNIDWAIIYIVVNLFMGIHFWSTSKALWLISSSMNPKMSVKTRVSDTF